MFFCLYKCNSFVRCATFNMLTYLFDNWNTFFMCRYFYQLITVIMMQIDKNKSWINVLVYLWRDLYGHSHYLVGLIKPHKQHGVVMPAAVRGRCLSGYADWKCCERAGSWKFVNTRKTNTAVTEFFARNGIKVQLYYQHKHGKFKD